MRPVYTINNLYRFFLRWGLIVGTLLGFPLSVQAQLTNTIPRIKPSIVAIGTYQPTRSPAFRFMGTGFAVGNGNLIATNAHVVPVVLESEAQEVLVAVIPGEEASVQARALTLVSRDNNHDLAVLSLEGKPLPALSLAADELVLEGQAVAFTGFPIGNVLGVIPVTHRGIVSAVTPISIPQANARTLTPAVIKQLSSGPFRIYQLDATAYPGNSGSPVFHPDTGEVLAVINMVFVKARKENAITAPSGISYAIPVAKLRALLSSIRP